MRRKEGQAKRRILSAARLAATRDLFEKTGIDARGSLDRLVPANLRRDTFYAVNDDSTLQNQFKRQIYFFLFLTDGDFKDGIASTFPSFADFCDRKRFNGIVFERDASVASDMLLDVKGFGVSDAFVLALEADNPMYNKSIAGLQRISLGKLDRENKRIENRRMEEEQGNVEGDAAGSIPEILDVLSYISDVWGNEKDQSAGNISALLNVLAADEFPILGDNEAVQIQKELHDVRSWQRKYDGLRPHRQAEAGTRRVTIEQLLSMKAVLSEHKELYESIQLLARKPFSKLQNNVGPDKAVSVIDSALSDLECRKNTMVTREKTNTEGRRIIPGGAIYHASKWEAFRAHPACHLKNKIVLGDQEDVEVEAVVLKTHHGNPKVFNDSLCVLNNEKPSSMKLSKQPNNSTKRRVKFLLSQLSCVDNDAASGTEGRSILCCWPDP